MNKTCRLIRNEFTGNWGPVAEIVKARGKRASGVIMQGASGAQFRGNCCCAPTR